MLWPIDQCGRDPALVPRLPARRAGGPQRLLRLPHRAARAALPGARCTCRRCAASSGAAPAAPEQADEALARRRAPSGRCSTASGRCPTPCCRRAFDAALPAGSPVVLAGRLRQRDPRRGGRAARGRSAPRCPPCSRRCTSTRSTARPHRVGRQDTALSYRDATWGLVDRRRRPRPGERPTAARAGRVDYWDALHPYSAGGAYVNMMMDEGQERVQASYRDNYDRLARDQAPLRPGQPVPREPEHPVRASRCPRPSSARGRTASSASPVGSSSPPPAGRLHGLPHALGWRLGPGALPDVS